MIKNGSNRRGVLLIFQCGFRVTPLAKLIKVDELVGVEQDMAEGEESPCLTMD